MKAQNVETLTLQTLHDSAQAASHALRAAQAGSRRLVKAVERRLTLALADRLEPRARRVAETLRSASEKARDQALNGVDRAGALAEAGIAKGTEQVATQVERLARVVESVPPVLGSGFKMAALVSRPGLTLARQASARVAEVSAEWPSRVAGEPLAKARSLARAQAKAAQGAKAKAGRAQARAASVLKAAEAEVTTTVRAARRSTARTAKATQATQAAQAVAAPKRSRATARRSAKA